MIKLCVLTAALAATALSASAASAADLRVSSPSNPIVRVSMAGKSAEQLNAQIQAAATMVCTDTQGLDRSCFDAAVDDATNQVQAFNLARHLASESDVGRSSDGTAAIAVSLKNKSPAQVKAEIIAAAQQVCTADASLDKACFDSTVADATDQLGAINHASRAVALANLAVEPDGPATVRISLKGKSPDQVTAEIAAAAQKVCSDTGPGGSEYDACVEAATSQARAQLANIAMNAPANEYASN